LGARREFMPVKASESMEEHYNGQELNEAEQHEATLVGYKRGCSYLASYPIRQLDGKLTHESGSRRSNELVESELDDACTHSSWHSSGAQGDDLPPHRVKPKSLCTNDCQ
jgi:hypothetical protein